MVPRSRPCQPTDPPLFPGCGGPAIPSADRLNAASIVARPRTSISSSTATCDCSISSTIGSNACLFLVRKVPSPPLVAQRRHFPKHFDKLGRQSPTRGSGIHGRDPLAGFTGLVVDTSEVAPEMQTHRGSGRYLSWPSRGILRQNSAGRSDTDRTIGLQLSEMLAGRYGAGGTEAHH